MSAKFREAVVTPPAVIHLWIRPFFRLLDELVLEQSADSSVKGTRSKTHSAAASAGDFLHHRVPMGFSVRKGHQDVKHCGREWQKIFSHDVSSSDITSSDIVSEMVLVVKFFLEKTDVRVRKDASRPAPAKAGAYAGRRLFRFS